MRWARRVVSRPVCSRSCAVLTSGFLLGACGGAIPAVNATVDAGLDAGAVFEMYGDYSDFATKLDCPHGLTPACIDAIYANVAASLAADTSVFAQAAKGPLSRPQVEAAFMAWEVFNASPELLAIETELTLVSAQPEFEALQSASADQWSLLITAGSDMTVFLYDLDHPGADGGTPIAEDLFGAHALSGAEAGANFFPLDTYDVNLDFTPNLGVGEFAHAISLSFLVQSTYAPAIPLSSGAWQSAASQVSTLAELVRERANARCQQAPLSPICQTVSAHELQVLAPALDALAQSVQSAAVALPTP